MVDSGIVPIIMTNGEVMANGEVIANGMASSDLEDRKKCN